MVKVYAERRYRVRSSMRSVVPVDPEIDCILVALHKRANATTEFLGAVTRIGSRSVIVKLLGLVTQGLVVIPGATPEDATAASVETLSTASWALTPQGAKVAIFAMHRERARAPRTTFAGGINPWTGQAMRL